VLDHRRWRTKARTLLTAAGLFVVAAAGGPGRLGCLPEPPDSPVAVAVPAIDPSPDPASRVEGVVAPGSYPVPLRLRVGVGPGVFLPVGSWADGFDPGLSLEAGVDRAVRPDMELGARVSRAEIRMEGRASLTWTSLEARAAWYPPVDLERLSIFLTGRAGLLRTVLAVGEGREDEWDLLTGGGGGVLVPISGRYAFRAEALWRRVFAEGQGFVFGGGLLIEL
jgi:hypothetical protein